MDDRIDVSAASAVLFVGDLLAVLAFVVVGEFRHLPREQALARTPETFLPFLVGWMLVAPLAGAYAEGIGRRPRTGAITVAAAWLGAALLGHAIRATDYVHGGFDPTFLAVSLLTVGALLVGWRLAVGYRRAR